MTDQPNAGASGRTPETGAIRNTIERVPHGSTLFCERCVASEQLANLTAAVERQQAEIAALAASLEMAFVAGARYEQNEAIDGSDDCSGRWWCENQAGADVRWKEAADRFVASLSTPAGRQDG